MTERMESEAAVETASQGGDTATPSTTEKEDAISTTEYPSGLRLVLILAAAAFSIFLVALDTTIVSTAIPKITDEFKSVNDIGWCASLLSSDRGSS